LVPAGYHKGRVASRLGKNNTLPLYHTGLYSLEQNRDHVALRAGAATLEKAPGYFRGTPAQMQRYQQRLRRERGQGPVSALGHDNHGYVFDTEVLIRAADRARAKRAFNLLVAAMAVDDMGIQFVPEVLDNNLIEFPASAPRPFAISGGGLLRACVLASRTSRSRRLQ
jgi:hypothetical protein